MNFFDCMDWFNAEIMPVLWSLLSIWVIIQGILMIRDHKAHLRKMEYMNSEEYKKDIYFDGYHPERRKAKEKSG